MKTLTLSTLVLCIAAPLGAQLRTTTVASGFTRPIDVTAAPGDRARLFVVERGGRIRIVARGSVLPTPFLDIGSRIRTDGDFGLLGIAFHPLFAQNGFFFVNYSRASDGATIVERFRVSAGDPDVADPGSGTIVLGPIAQPDLNHNGGCIRFGPDGYLYVGMGDGGMQRDPNCLAQNRQRLLGKMLRIDVDNPNSNIPPTNPFVGDPTTLDEIWAIGLRNPWRFSFDRETGDLYVADVGQFSWEEIDFQAASSQGGENYGWKVMEGLSCHSTQRCAADVPACNSPQLTLPIHVYATGGDCSITGGFVYRGCAVPSLRGTYFFGDFCSGRVWSLRYVNGQVTELRDRSAELGGPFAGLVSFGEDADGELYIVRFGAGRILKIEPTASSWRDLGFGKVGGNGLVPSFTLCGLLTAGESAEFRLDDAPMNTGALLVIGLQNNPTNFGNLGTLVPVPPLFSAPVVTDGEGRVRFSLPGGTGAATVYAQWILADAGATGGVGVSNAVEINLQ